MSNKPKNFKSNKSKEQINSPKASFVDITPIVNLYQVSKSNYEICLKLAKTLKEKIRDKTFVAYSVELNDMDTLISVVNDCLNALMYWDDFELDIFNDWYTLAEDLGNWAQALSKDAREEYMTFVYRHPYNNGYRYAKPTIMDISGLCANDIGKLIS